MHNNTKEYDKPTFINDVFPSEIEEIKRRRTTLAQTTGDLEDSPSVDNKLAGLAISGGGIRSATFSLGVIQTLTKLGFLKSVDYLSTVSGGGYTGACLSSLLNQTENKFDDKNFPLKYTSGNAEPPALMHLRNSSNYLTPEGLLNKLRLPNLLLRGILLNLFIFMPFIMAAVFLTEFAYEQWPDWSYLTLLVMPLSLIFILMTVAFPFSIRVMRRLLNWQRRNICELLLTIPLLLVIGILIIVPILRLIKLAIEHNTAQVLMVIDTISSATLWQLSAIGVGILILFMFAGKASKNAAQLSSKIFLLTIGLIGPAFIFCIYLALCLWQIDSPYMPASSINVLNQLTDCKQPCLVNSDTQTANESNKLDPSAVAHLLKELTGRSISLSENAVVRCQSGDCQQSYEPHQWSLDKRVWVINDAPQLQAACPPLSQVSPFENAGVVGNCHYLSRYSVDQLRIDGDQLHLFGKAEDFHFFILFIGLLIFNRFFLDMNITSAHGFYRDRLSKAYLFNTDHNNGVVHNDKLKLSELNAPNTTAPYHLISVALNLQASKDADLRGRKSDFFLLSKHFIGCDRTGFTPTTEMEKYDQHMDLGTAMAVSGAAAAPNMGTTTNRSLVFILTLLNIRLGYWLPNPKRVNSKKWYHHLGLSGAKPTLIWREALGKMDAKGSHVNISDGGHIENLAIYPLLKRRCKYIIAIDGEADPNMTFGGLVKLMRFARIDMGTEIDIDLTDLRKASQGLSKTHYLIGKINYSNGEVGQLLYIKLSVVGDEPEYVRAYRTDNPAFPHETTADQFFSEDQFEAYRALGEHSCKRLLNNRDALGDLADLLT